MEYLTTDTELGSVADAIRQRGGTSAPLVYPAGFVSAIAAIPSGGGGTEAEDGIIARTISGTYGNSTVSSIGSYAFRFCQSLTEVRFTACSVIGSNAFINCDALRSAWFPSCVSIGSSAFYSCKSMVTASFPACRTIYSNAFAYAWSLPCLCFPRLVSVVGSYAFRGCTRLVSMYLPGSTVVSLGGGSTAFASTPIGGYSASAGRFGSIYVPASLYSAYISADAWSRWSSRFASLAAFSVNGSACQAETDAVWGSWISGPLSPSGVDFSIPAGGYVTWNGRYLTTSSGYVQSAHQIMPGYDYGLE